MKPCIEVVNENVAVADSIARLLIGRGHTVRTSRSAEEYLSGPTSAVGTVTLVSFGLPEQGAERILSAVAAGHRRTLVVMLSDGVEASRIVRAVKAGAEDVLESPGSEQELLSVIERMSQVALTQDFAPDPTLQLVDSLTEDEQRILGMLEQGSTIKEIAARLDVSIRTVHYRRASILEKTGCRNRTEAVAKLSSLRRASSNGLRVRHNRAV